MNTRLVRASQFLRQFRLDVRHKPGKEHIVPDALSRLALAKSSTILDDHSKLDALHLDYNYTSTQVQMSDSFCARLAKGYANDDRWAKVIKVLDDKANMEKKFNFNGEVAKLPFVCQEGGLNFPR